MTGQTASSLPENGDMPEDAPAKGYLRNCLLMPREYGERMFRTTDYTVHAYLDGYAIIPREKYDDLRTRLEQAEELAGLKQGVIEAADVRINELLARLDQAERDSKRLDWLSQNEYGLRAIDGNSYHAAPLDVRDLIDAAIAASLPTPKQGAKSV